MHTFCFFITELYVEERREMQGLLVKLAFLLTFGARMVCSVIFLVVSGCKVRHSRRNRFCAKQALEGGFRNSVVDNPWEQAGDIFRAKCALEEFG